MKGELKKGVKERKRGGKRFKLAGQSKKQRWAFHKGVGGEYKSTTASIRRFLEFWGLRGLIKKKQKRGEGRKKVNK